MHSRTAVGNGTGNAGSFRESYEMLHSLRVAPLYRILPSSLTPRILITYVPALGLPTHLRLRLISSARFHNLLPSHLVPHPFQGLSRQRMDQMVGPQRIRTTPGRTLSVTKSNRDSVEGSRRGLHLAAYARSAGKAKRKKERLTPTQYMEVRPSFELFFFPGSAPVVGPHLASQASSC